MDIQQLYIYSLSERYLFLGNQGTAANAHCKTKPGNNKKDLQNPGDLTMFRVSNPMRAGMFALERTSPREMKLNQD